MLSIYPWISFSLGVTLSDTVFNFSFHVFIVSIWIYSWFLCIDLLLGDSAELINSKSCFLFWDFPHRQLYFLQIGILLFLPFQYRPFISFSCLKTTARTSRAMKTDTLALFLIRGGSIQLFTIKYDVISCRCLIDAHQVKVIPLYS